MEVLKIVLPDKQTLYTHELADEHTQRIIRHWVAEHSDEYELPGFDYGQVLEHQRDKQTGEWLYLDGNDQTVRSKHAPGSHQVRHLRPLKAHERRVMGEQESTGKKRPICNFDLLDMPENQYREMRPYAAHPTCRTP